MDAKTPPPYRRRQLIVNRPLQFRFVKAMLLFFGVLTAATIGGVYLALWATLYTFQLLEDPLTVSLFTTVGWVVVLEMILLSPFVFWMAILLTHKVAGPLVRIRAVLKQMTEGRLDVHVKLRKGDALVELADDLNGLIASLRQKPKG